MTQELALGLVFGSYALFILLDFVSPARSFSKIRYWRTKGLLAHGLSFFVGSYSPFLWDSLLAEHRLIDATGLGTIGGAIVGLLAYQFALYWVHRAMHHSNQLWRWSHQAHHSAERVDIWGAMLFNPLDVLIFGFMGSSMLVWAVGITPEAALCVYVALTFFAFFQHANIKTPVWLGYFVQRPEAHCVHHSRAVHRHNYADLPIFDILFGTFENPANWEGQAGFYDGASERVLAMLAGRDIAAEGPAPAEHQPSVSTTTASSPG